MKPKKREEQSTPVAVTAEERYHLINDAAYFRALLHQNETGDQAQTWFEVESEIDGVLRHHHARP